MYLDVPSPDVKTIVGKASKSANQAVKSLVEELKIVSSYPVFQIPVYPAKNFFKADTRLKTWMHRFNDNPYSCDPTIDTNGRTGGHTHPIQISWKGRVNGSCFDSQAEDWNALCKTHAHLVKPLKRVWREWNYNLSGRNFSYSEGTSRNFSRLVALHDHSCKTRVVAIFDNLSQIALRPVHLMIEEVLKKLPCDFTFNHLDGVHFLLKNFSQRMCHSVDIKSATDTIPRNLSKEILGLLVNPKIVRTLSPQQFVDDVFSILTNRKFAFKGNNLKYGVGQPMGAYASFPLLALTNHFMVQVAALRALEKYQYFSDYAIVGDDVVIANDLVHYHYAKLLKDLGIPISNAKCISAFGTFEFCKRIVRDGEIKSVPTWNSIYSSVVSKDPVPLMQICKKYGIPLNYEFLTTFYKRRYVRTAFAFESFDNIKLSRGGSLSVEMIPANVVGHSVRCLQIRETLLSPKDLELYTENPFLNRLNYSKNIRSMFRQASTRKGRTASKLIQVEKLDKMRLYKELDLDPRKRKDNPSPFLEIDKIDLSIDSDREKYSDYIIVQNKTEQSAPFRDPVPIWELAHKVIANTFYLNYVYNYLDRKKIKISSFVRSSNNGSSLRLRSYAMSQKLNWVDDRLLNPVKQDKVVQTVATLQSKNKISYNSNLVKTK
jgi:hypothetical protein